MKNARKTALRLLLVAGLAGAASMTAFKQKAISSLQGEHKLLLDKSEEARRLAQQNQDVERLREEVAEADKLRAENIELLGLRNTVTQLRKQAEELAKVPAEQQQTIIFGRRGNFVLQGGTIQLAQETTFSKAELADQGFGIPRATLQTYYWAMCQGNAGRVSECLTPSALARFQAQTGADAGTKLQDDMRNFTGYQITGRTQTSQEEVVLAIKLLGSDETQQVHFKWISNQWKIDQ